MCLAGAVVACWFLIQEAGLSPFNVIIFLPLNMLNSGKNSNENYAVAIAV